MSPKLALEILTYAFESDKPLYRATLQAVAEAAKSGPFSWNASHDPSAIRKCYQTLARPSLEMVTGNLIRAWLVKKHKDMLVDFLMRSAFSITKVSSKNFLNPWPMKSFVPPSMLSWPNTRRIGRGFISTPSTI